MKHIIAALTAVALLGFAVPAFACDGHKKADKQETTTTQAEAGDDHTCNTDCDHGDKAKKKAKAESEEKAGEV